MGRPMKNRYVMICYVLCFFSWLKVENLQYLLGGMRERAGFSTERMRQTWISEVTKTIHPTSFLEPRIFWGICTCGIRARVILPSPRRRFGRGFWKTWDFNANWWNWKHWRRATGLVMGDLDGFGGGWATKNAWDQTTSRSSHPIFRELIFWNFAPNLSFWQL